MTLTVNGEGVRYRLDPATPLLWALREASNLTGTKNGCGTGDCGACTVLVDGRAVLSCLLPLSRCAGADVTTIEGLAPNKSHAVQQAWIAEQASQCGFCVPGFILATVALLTVNPRPDAAAIDAALPNLCRCGGYDRIRRAVLRAADALALAA